MKVKSDRVKLEFYARYNPSLTCSAWVELVPFIKHSGVFYIISRSQYRRIVRCLGSLVRLVSNDYTDCVTVVYKNGIGVYEAIFV